jgi:hypothetical protein
MDKIQVSFKSDKNTNFLSYLAQFFLEWEIFQTNVIEKIKTNILLSITFFPVNHALYEIIQKNTVQSDSPQVAI